MEKQIVCYALKIVALSVLLLTSVAGYAQLRYPYVQEGRIIVCREGSVGVKSSLIHPNWTKTPEHQAGDMETNRMAAKFEVAIASVEQQNFSAAEQRCAAYSSSSGAAGTWRIPTVKELWLIYLLSDQLVCGELFLAESSLYWWSASKNVSRMYVLNTSRHHLNCRSTTEVHMVICVRDL